MSLSFFFKYILSVLKRNPLVIISIVCLVGVGTYYKLSSKVLFLDNSNFEIQTNELSDEEIPVVEAMDLEAKRSRIKLNTKRGGQITFHTDEIAYFKVEETRHTQVVLQDKSTHNLKSNISSLWSSLENKIDYHCIKSKSYIVNVCYIRKWESRNYSPKPKNNYALEITMEDGYVIRLPKEKRDELERKDDVCY